MTLNIPTPFVNGWPLNKWYRLFLKRYPDLKRRQAQLLLKQWASFSQNALDNWFQELYEYLHKIRHADILNQPARIFNANETGFPMAPRPCKVLAVKGNPHIYQQGSSNEAQITTLLMASAAAFYVKPLVVYPSTNFHKTFMETFYWELPNAIFGHSTSGWMDQELFQNWLENSFIPEVKWAGIPCPILLLINGAKCHISLFISEICNQENIIIYTLLLNTTHLIQALNLTLMGSVKTVYKEEV